MTMLQAGEFGIVGDGQTDNSAALKALRNAIRSGPDRAWQVDFDTGHYCYSDNTWALFGDRDVTLHFNHSKIECFSTDPWATNYGLFPMAGPFAFWGDGLFNLARMVLPPGTLIGRAERGDRSVTLQGPLDGDPLEPGEVLLIGGYVQQTTVEPDGTVVGWGAPANLRFFEFKTVAAVPAGDVVQLVEPLRHSYDGSWPDLKHTLLGPTVRFYGKPRMWRCRLPKYAMTRALRIERAHFVGNRDQPAAFTPCPFHGILHAIIDGCTFAADIGASNTFNKRCEFHACRFLAPYEADKLVEQLSFVNCELMGDLTSHGGGVRLLELRNTTVVGKLEGAVREMRFDNLYAQGPVVLNGGVAEALVPYTVTITAGVA